MCSSEQQVENIIITKYREVKENQINRTGIVGEEKEYTQSKHLCFHLADAFL